MKKFKEFCSTFAHAVARRKSPEPDVMTTSLRRCLTTVDLTLYGLGTMIGGAIYGIISVVVATKAGPGVTMSFFLAGLAAYFNGLCYSELASRIPRAGSAYTFTYLTGGELLAFLVGWGMVLEYLLQSVFSTIGAADTLNVLANNAIKESISRNIGMFPQTGGIIEDYPNLVAVTFAIGYIAVIACGVKISAKATGVVTVVYLSIIVIATIYMFFYSYGFQWAVDDFHGGFTPWGIHGVLGGAALAFNAFNGYDAISISSEEAIDPQRSIPRAISTAVILVLVLSVTYAFSVITYLPWWLVNATTGLAGIFRITEVPWLMYLAGIGAILGFLTNGLCSLAAVSRVLYALANDGLFFHFMGYVHPTDQVPIIAAAVTGIFVAVISMLFSFSTIANFLSVGTLVCYSIVASEVILLRFLQPQIYLDDQSKKPDEGIGKLWPVFHRCVPFLDNTPQGWVPIGSLIAFFPISAALLVSLFYGNESWWMAVIIVLLIVSLVLCCLLIVMHRFQTTVTGYEVPGMPFTPLVSIFMNISMVVNIQGRVWYRLLAWWSLGFIIYLGYGMWHSKLRIHMESIPHPSFNDTDDNLLGGALEENLEFPQPKTLPQQIDSPLFFE